MAIFGFLFDHTIRPCNLSVVLATTGMIAKAAGHLVGITKEAISVGLQEPLKARI